MDGKGRALDNIFTERLWRSTKWENVYLVDYADVADARAGQTAYFTYDNMERPQQSLAYKKPADVYFQTTSERKDSLPGHSGETHLPEKGDHAP